MFLSTFHYIWNWIIAMTSEIRAVFGTILNACQHDYTRPLSGNKNGQDLPIVFIHGSSGNQLEWVSAWEQICKKFPNHPCWAFSLDVPFEPFTGKQDTTLGYLGLKRLAHQHNWSIEDYATALESRVEFVRNKYPGKRVILFGHSMGGLIACAYRHHDHVAAIVTFASPLRGTSRLLRWPIRNILTSRRHKEMTPGSDFLKRVQERATGCTYILSIGSENDIQVPDDYARMEGCAHMTVARFGHMSITENPDALARAAEFITSQEYFAKPVGK
jgi:hypothetical protein